MNQPPAPFVRLRLTESQAAQAGLLLNWQLARKKIVSRAQRQADSEGRLKGFVQRLLAHAASQKEPWSQRRLAREAGLSWPTWLRIRNARVNARRWLSRLEAAIARLKVG